MYMELKLSSSLSSCMVICGDGELDGDGYGNRHPLSPFSTLQPQKDERLTVNNILDDGKELNYGYIIELALSN